jgi:hypothetical protein
MFQVSGLRPTECLLVVRSGRRENAEAAQAFHPEAMSDKFSNVYDDHTG